jgi:uncharacterized repeat protein (TIGR01451 family)
MRLFPFTRWLPFTRNRQSSARPRVKPRWFVPRLERLEKRCVPAVITAFSTTANGGFSTIAHGNIAIIGNTVTTAPATNVNATNAQNGVGSVLDWTSFNPMAFVNVDPTSGNFDSSRATLNMPAGSTVLYAALFWGGTAKGINSNVYLTVKLATPTSGGVYTNLTGAQSGKGGAAGNEYGAWINVTSLVAAAGNGTYTAANIQTTPAANTKRYGGWSLVVVYENPADPPRSLTVFGGYANVPGSTNATVANRTTTIPISGFVTPPTGPVNAQLGFVSYAGDLGQTGDTLSLNGAQLSNATRPANNFFNSSINNLGVPVTGAGQNPNFVNQIGGVDIGTLSAAGILTPGSTSTTLTAVGQLSNVANNGYNPQVFTLAIDLYDPDVTTVKTAADLTQGSGSVLPGDVLQYTVQVQNTGGDAAANMVLTDPIPANTTYVPNSMHIIAGPNVGPKTDAAGDDQAEFNAAGNRVVFRLGTGATATAGGHARRRRHDHYPVRRPGRPQPDGDPDHHQHGNHHVRRGHDRGPGNLHRQRDHPLHPRDGRPGADEDRQRRHPQRGRTRHVHHHVAQHRTARGNRRHRPGPAPGRAGLRQRHPQPGRLQPGQRILDRGQCGQRGDGDVDHRGSRVGCRRCDQHGRDQPLRPAGPGPHQQHSQYHRHAAAGRPGRDQDGEQCNAQRRRQHHFYRDAGQRRA